MKNHRIVHRVVRSIGFYPITMLYIAGCAMVIVVFKGILSVVVGLVVLGLFAVMTMLLATWRELVTVRQMVDGQRTEMIARMDNLVYLLIENGIAVPHQGPKEDQARQQHAYPLDTPGAPNAMTREGNNYGEGRQ